MTCLGAAHTAQTLRGILVSVFLGCRSPQQRHKLPRENSASRLRTENLTIGLDAVLQAEELPASIADLHASLADVDAPEWERGCTTQEHEERLTWYVPMALPAIVWPLSARNKHICLRPFRGLVGVVLCFDVASTVELWVG